MDELIEYKIHPIKAFRIAHDLTQKRLAELIGIKSPEPIMSVEKGRRGCSPKIAEGIERVSKGKLKKEVLVFLDPAEFNRDNPFS